jgi:hypothetical protein
MQLGHVALGQAGNKDEKDRFVGARIRAPQETRML